MIARPPAVRIRVIYNPRSGKRLIARNRIAKIKATKQVAATDLFGSFVAFINAIKRIVEIPIRNIAPSQPPSNTSLVPCANVTKLVVFCPIPVTL